MDYAHNVLQTSCILTTFGRTFSNYYLFDSLIDVLLHVTGEHQLELLDYAAAKFHEEAGVFKLLVSFHIFYIFVTLYEISVMMINRIFAIDLSAMLFLVCNF